MSTNNMKSTWPTRKFCVGDPMKPIFHLFPFGVCVGGTQILAFALRVTQILAFLDANMLVSSTQKSRIGDIIQCEGVCVAVEYSL